MYLLEAIFDTKSKTKLSQKRKGEGEKFFMKILLALREKTIAEVVLWDAKKSSLQNR